MMSFVLGFVIFMIFGYMVEMVNLFIDKVVIEGIFCY